MYRQSSETRGSGFKQHSTLLLRAFAFLLFAMTFTQQASAEDLTCTCTAFACGNGAVGGDQGDIFTGVSPADVAKSFTTNPATGWTCEVPSKTRGAEGPKGCFCAGSCGNGGMGADHNYFDMGLDQERIDRLYGGGLPGNRTGWLCGNYRGSFARNSGCSNTRGQELQDPPIVNANGYHLFSQLSFEKADKCINGVIVEDLRSHIARDIHGNEITDSRPVGPAFVVDLNENNHGQSSAVLDVVFSNNIDPADCAIPGQCDCSYESNTDVGLCTNLHTHGFRVSPTAHSDDVLVTHPPGVSNYRYSFVLPDYHAPGTHWMHPHFHGSTAPQVAEGAAGALILKGEVDHWLENTVGAKDHIMILQQLLVNNDSSGSPLCGNVVTSINGQCAPKITASENEILRMRLIHAGVSQTVMFGIEDTTGRPLDVNEFARDGVNLGELWTNKAVELQPGYRSDILFQVPRIADVCPNTPNNCVLNIVDNESTSAQSLFGKAEEEHIIATINISHSFSNHQMPAKNDPHFAQPYAHIEDEALVDNDVNLWFASIKGESGTDHTIMGEVYPHTKHFEVNLGDAQEWNIWVGAVQKESRGGTSSGPSHPYHIHVNPFETKVKDPDGNDKWIWKDTLLVSSSANASTSTSNDQNLIPPDNAITIRSRYETFEGTFVMHCHNLFHEDKGMMSKVTINNGMKHSH